LYKWRQHEAHSLLERCFQEWSRDIQVERHLREYEECQTWITRVQRELSMKDEQLQLVYQQVDSITATLQKEIKTKEDLAAELREAYDKMRHISIPPSPAPSSRGILTERPVMRSATTSQAESEASDLEATQTTTTYISRRSRSASGIGRPNTPGRGGVAAEGAARESNSTSWGTARFTRSRDSRPRPPPLATEQNDSGSYGSSPGILVSRFSGTSNLPSTSRVSGASDSMWQSATRSRDSSPPLATEQNDSGSYGSSPGILVSRFSGTSNLPSTSRVPGASASMRQSAGATRSEDSPPTTGMLSWDSAVARMQDEGLFRGAS